jgi:WD40 repeat protein
MIYEEIGEVTLLITGSADRCIKLWDCKLQKVEPCIQTLMGHSGSVLQIKFIPQVRQLVSSSSDRTLRIWR